MLKPALYLNEIVSLTVMLLMVIALVAGQADARSLQHARTDATAVGTDLIGEENMPFRTIIKAHIDGQPLTISIDAEAKFRYLPVDDG